MLLALYYFIINVALPQLEAYASALLVLAIAIAGVIMLFGAVGMKISNNLGSTIVGGIFRAIGYLCRKIFQAIGWIICRMIPSVYKGSKKTFNQLGMNALFSNLLSVVVVIIVLAIII